MIRNVLTRIDGIETYGIVSIALFFTFFIRMLVWAFRIKKPHLDAMSEMPLERAQDQASRVTSSSNNATGHE